MKKNLLLLLFVFVCSVTFAQNPLATPVSPSKKGNPELAKIAKSYYCCMYCDYTAKALRSCPVHQAALVKVGDWYCPVDGKSSTKAGTCEKDNITMIRMEMKFKTVTPNPPNPKNNEPLRK